VLRRSAACAAGLRPGRRYPSGATQAEMAERRRRIERGARPLRCGARNGTTVMRLPTGGIDRRSWQSTRAASRPASRTCRINDAKRLESRPQAGARR
jgi:hypothetical protein